MTTRIIDTLNRLIENCKDGEYGFRSCAEHARGVSLRQLFEDRARECQRSAADLQALVVELGGQAEDGGSTMGALHRGWVAVKAKLSGYTDYALLEECERGEDVSLERYAKALEEDLPGVVRPVVMQQYAQAQRTHAQIRALRDQTRFLNT